MNILAIDTSTKKLSLAVGQKGRVLRRRNVQLTRPLSNSIISDIRAVLKSAGLTLDKIDGFAVGLGPGSFTSLRVGLATVKGMVFASPKPVVGISSLDLIALNTPRDHGRICVLSDAKRNMVYSAVYEKDGHRLTRTDGYHLSDVKDVLARLSGEVVFIGDGMALYGQEIKKRRGLKPVLFDGKHASPQARHLITLSADRFRNDDTDDIGKLVPLYLYPEHCQIAGKTRK